MQLLRFIFNLQTIYFRQTYPQILVFYLSISLVLWITISLITFYGSLPWQVFIPTLVVASYMLTRTLLRTFLVERHMKQHPASAFTVSESASNELFRASMNLELNGLDKVKPLAVYGDAMLYVAMFDFHRNYDGGSYLAKQAYYTVVQIQLKRRLPHLLFDSRSAKRRQFRYQYLKAQHISIQGSFDDIFDTYTPQTYQIDTLSFVTPEVMEALVRAQIYDIEIIDDKLFLYAPLIGKETTESLAKKGLAIAKALNDNINTYRDDRLKGEERKKEVTVFARALLKSPVKHLVAAGLLGLLIIALAVIAMLVDADYAGTVLLNEYSIFIYFSFVASSWQAFKIVRDNKKTLRRYELLHHTDRGKPVKHSVA